MTQYNLIFDLGIKYVVFPIFRSVTLPTNFKHYFKDVPLGLWFGLTL